MHGHERLRRGCCSESGRVYLVTAVTQQRRPYFDDWTLAARASRALSQSGTWPTSRLLSWVLMPDHWHGLVELGGEPLPLAIGRFKAIVSRDVGRSLGRPLRLWAPCFHDHALRHDASLVHAARYIVANPLRAGLVSEIGAYPFWDSVWMQG